MSKVRAIASPITGGALRIVVVGIGTLFGVATRKTIGSIVTLSIRE